MFTIQTSDFKKLLTAVAPIRSTAEIIVSGNNLTVKAMNGSMSAMGSFSIDVESDEDVKFNIDVEKMSSMMKSIRSQKCMIDVKDIITVIGGKSTFTIEKISFIETIKGIPKPRDDIYVSVNGKDLYENVEALKVLDDIISFKFKDGKLFLDSEKNMTNEKIVIEFDIISVTNSGPDSRADFIYNLVSPLVREISSCNKVEIKFADWSLLSIRGINDSIDIEYIIAPAEIKKE